MQLCFPMTLFMSSLKHSQDESRSISFIINSYPQKVINRTQQHNILSTCTQANLHLYYLNVNQSRNQLTQLSTNAGHQTDTLT